MLVWYLEPQVFSPTCLLSRTRTRARLSVRRRSQKREERKERRQSKRATVFPLQMEASLHVQKRQTLSKVVI